MNCPNDEAKRANGFARGCGIALALAGGLLILTNVGLTPLLPTQQGEAILRASAVYLIRISAAGATALLLLFGCLGLHLAQRSASGRFGAAAFLVSFVGNSLVIAVEWTNGFVLRAVAQTAPEALGALDGSALMTTGFAAAAGLFALGWLMLSVSIWRAGVLPRWAALTTIAGLILIPVLGATPLGIGGAIAGNVVFGSGLMGLGRALARVR